MLSIYLLILVTLLIIIFLFSSPKFSPVPYFPSQPVDMPLIIEALNLKNNQTIIDLGAGDGIVIFKAADESFKKKLNTQFIGVEINPILILILNIRRLFHPNRKNIKIIHGDIFNIELNNFTNFINFKNLITVYLYISPWFLEKVIENCKSKIENFNVVSYMYPIKSLSSAKASEDKEIIQGRNKIFLYNGIHG